MIEETHCLSDSAVEARERELAVGSPVSPDLTMPFTLELILAELRKINKNLSSSHPRTPILSTI